MERLDTWTVRPEDERPARQDGTCFYCREPIGGKHKSDCVIPQKSVMMDFTIRLPVLVPASWNKDQIESLYNGSSWYCDNLLNYISEWKEKSGRCLCSAVEVRYASDANADEDKNAV